MYLRAHPGFPRWGPTPGVAAGAAALVLACAPGGAADAGAQARKGWESFRRPTVPVTYPELLVSARELHVRLGSPSTVVLDAGPRARFLHGHVPAARLLEPASWDGDPASLAALLAAAGVSDRDTVVCMADSSDPAASGTLLWMLDLAGMRAGRVLNGGLEAWTRDGGALASGPPSPRTARFAARPDTARIATYDYLLAHYGRAGTSVLDWRPVGTWAGGHIPYSLPFNLGSLLDERGALRPGSSIRPIFEQWGPRPQEYVNLEDDLVVCGDFPPGSVPVHPYLAARVAGIARVRVYPGGYADWRTHADAPVVRIVHAAALRQRLHDQWGGTLPDLPPGRFLLLDLRGERDFDRGHIPGAVSLPVDRLDRDLEATVAEYWPGADRARTPVVFYCYGPGCTRSRNGANLAAHHGFLKLEWFRDGVDGWKEAGERLVKSR